MLLFRNLTARGSLARYEIWGFYGEKRAKSEEREARGGKKLLARTKFKEVLYCCFVTNLRWDKFCFQLKNCLPEARTHTPAGGPTDGGKTRKVVPSVLPSVRPFTARHKQLFTSFHHFWRPLSSGHENPSTFLIIACFIAPSILQPA
jgi:hypothetical protein